MGETIVGFDVGNSTVKAGWFHDSRVEGIRTARHHSPDDVEEFIDLALSDRPFRSAVIATVNKPASDRLADVLERRSIRIRRTYESNGALFDEGLIGCGVDTPHTTGVDRLLACIAALRKSPGQDVVVVACGSAITVNLTTSDGVFQGGAILPGLGLMGRSLHEGTAALPRITCPPSPERMKVEGEWGVPTLPGRSTMSAMRAGVYFAAVGGIERLIAEVQHSVGRPLTVHMTGGDGELLCRALHFPFTFSPCLVLDGLCEVASSTSS